MKRLILLVALFTLAACSDNDTPAPRVLPPPIIVPPPEPCVPMVGWSLPTEYANGDAIPLVDIVQLAIYAWRVPLATDAELVFKLDVDPHVLQWTFTELDPGAWYFSGTVTDIFGAESDRSNQVAVCAE